MSNRFFRELNQANGWGYCITFVGTDWDTQIAIYIYHFLTGHFRREWKTKRGRLRNRQAFIWGMYVGLSEKLRERQPKAEPQPGLVTTDRQLQRRNDYVAKHFGEVRGTSVSPDGAATAARVAGYYAGQDTEIRPAVKPPSDETRLLT